MRETYMEMLADTLRICEQGYYEHDGRRIELKLSPEEMRKAYVLLPEDVEQ